MHSVPLAGCPGVAEFPLSENTTWSPGAALEESAVPTAGETLITKDVGHPEGPLAPAQPHNSSATPAANGNGSLMRQSLAAAHDALQRASTGSPPDLNRFNHSLDV